MNAHLAYDREHRSEILKHTLKMAEAYFSHQQTMPPGMLVADLPKDLLSEDGDGAMATLEFFDREYAHLITNSAGPRYFGLVTGGSTPAAVAADWLVSTYDQNACGSNDSIAPQLEKQTVEYFKQLFGLPSEYHAAFVTGATMANFVGLALARQWVGERYGVDIAIAGMEKIQLRIFSAAAHSSILKSMSMLGIGRDAMIRVDTLADREAIDIEKLENILKASDCPLIVVANAGTVNTGDFDDLQAMAALKSKYSFWLHIDAAFGGFAASSEKLGHLMKGVDAADSLTVDAHKWLNVPYDAAMQFTRHPELQLKVFQNTAAYLTDPSKSHDYFHYTPESSRRWRALPAWFSLRAYGRKGIRDIVERNCLLAEKFGRAIDKSNEFKLLSPVRLNIVCFTLNDPALNADLVHRFLQEVRKDGKVYFTPTVYNGVPAIRAAISNWQTEEKDMDIAFHSIVKVINGMKLIPGHKTF